MHDLNPGNAKNLVSMIPKLKEISLGAGDIIMSVYKSHNFNVQFKADNSYVTSADLAAHDHIVRSLKASWPDINIVSEEDDTKLSDLKDIDCFWLVDPLDGTKEFLHKTGEFTVNIALIKNSRVVLGVVYAPALDLLYWGGAGLGSYRTSNGNEKAINVSLNTSNKMLRVEVSKSHLNDETKSFIEQLAPIKVSCSGSSLKFCRVAEGAADVYPRLAPTCEWDTAAAQAVLEGAGGVVVDLQGKALRYGKPEMLNPSFIATCDMTLIPT
jgi:3'(2'), 5'-bisphosphate nucleotidase